MKTKNRIGAILIISAIKDNIFLSLLYRETTEKQIPRRKKVIRVQVAKSKDAGTNSRLTINKPINGDRIPSIEYTFFLIIFLCF